MKKNFRALLICLALIMCLTSVLVACNIDNEETDTEDSTIQTTDSSNETSNETSTEDATETPTEDTTEASTGEGESLTGRQIIKVPSPYRTHYFVMYQVEETNGKTSVKCSLVLHDASDDSVLDSVVFDVKVNGQDAKSSCCHETKWYKDRIEVVVRDHDGALTTYTLSLK